MVVAFNQAGNQKAAVEICLPGTCINEIIYLSFVANCFDNAVFYKNGFCTRQGTIHGGEEEFIKITGLSPDRIADFEKWGIFEPKQVDGAKVYSHHDLTIGRVIGTMRAAGISYEKGFSEAGLRDVRDMFRSIVSKAGDEFDFGVRNKVSFEKAVELGDIYVEIMATFFYHLSHRLAREEIDQRLNAIKSEPAE